MHNYYALSIAGTDPTSGAGIQADLKTFSALGVYGATVITSLVAQNTRGVQSVYPIHAHFVSTQIESVFSDMQIDTVKIGLLGQESVIHAVANKIKQHPVPYIVLDTVIFSKSGDMLLDTSAISSLRNILIPLASVITPNIIEAAMILGCTPAKNEDQMRQQGQELLSLGCEAVIIKGGHLTGNQSTDLLISQNLEHWCSSTRIATSNTHGTGCTLSAALTALRPRYNSWIDTLKEAKSWLQQALIRADTLQVGKGSGPVHHFYKWW